MKSETPIITGRVTDAGGSHGPVRLAEVRLHAEPQREGDSGKKAADKAAETDPIDRTLTDDEGRFRFSRLIEAGARYRVECTVFGENAKNTVVASPGEVPADLHPNLGMQITTLTCPDGGAKSERCTRGQVGRRFLVRVEAAAISHAAAVEVTASPDISVAMLPDNEAECSPARPGIAHLHATMIDRKPNSSGTHPEAHAFADIAISPPDFNYVGGKLGVALERTAVPHTLDTSLWAAIRNRTRAISFGPYRDFMNRVFCEEERLGMPELDRRIRDLGANIHGVSSYLVLKTATEVFLLMECGVKLDRQHFDAYRESARMDERVTFDFVRGRLREYLGSPPQLPYITRVVEAAFPWLERDGMCCDRVISARINEPCLIELIWNYWHEEGMLVQTMNAIDRRFQNVRAPGERDPLANLELDPLRPVGNVLWGQIQDEINLLSVKRRAYEYSHQYGLSLYGKATGSLRPADNRSKFLEAFHNLLHLTSVFYKEDNDTTVIADGFPLLNALKEVHLLLAQGAHNQFGDLPWTARAEMMVSEWILSRPAIREFLQSRAMVPYIEDWMPQVDAMKTMQGWSDVTVTHFRDLGVFGEQILLSIRYGDWIAINDEDSPRNWARYWRPEIQGYLHAYRAVTGVDLTNPDTVDATAPAFHLQKRLVAQLRMR